jgi:hypothetical protein
MLVTKLKGIAAVAVTLGLLAAGAIAFQVRAGDGPENREPVSKVDGADQRNADDKARPIAPADLKPAAPVDLKALQAAEADLLAAEAKYKLAKVRYQRLKAVIDGAGAKNPMGGASAGSPDDKGKPGPVKVSYIKVEVKGILDCPRSGALAVSDTSTISTKEGTLELDFAGAVVEGKLAGRDKAAELDGQLVVVTGTLRIASSPTGGQRAIVSVTSFKAAEEPAGVPPKGP